VWIGEGRPLDLPAICRACYSVVVAQILIFFFCPNGGGWMVTFVLGSAVTFAMFGKGTSNGWTE
jgi:hypothetical protein